jgi:hypothetical protein
MAEPADTRDIAVLGDPARARDTVAAALTARKFKLAWGDAWTGTATKGSRAKQIFLGALAPHIVLGLSVISTDAGTVVRITRAPTGISGGLAGRARSKRQFASVVDEVTRYFGANGVLQAPGAAGPPPIA